MEGAGLLGLSSGKTSIMIEVSSCLPSCPICCLYFRRPLPISHLELVVPDHILGRKGMSSWACRSWARSHQPHHLRDLLLEHQVRHFKVSCVGVSHTKSSIVPRSRSHFRPTFRWNGHVSARRRVDDPRHRKPEQRFGIHEAEIVQLIQGSDGLGEEGVNVHRDTQPR